MCFFNFSVSTKFRMTVFTICRNGQWMTGNEWVKRIESLGWITKLGLDIIINHVFWFVWPGNVSYVDQNVSRRAEFSTKSLYCVYISESLGYRYLDSTNYQWSDWKAFCSLGRKIKHMNDTSDTINEDIANS